MVLPSKDLTSPNSSPRSHDQTGVQFYSIFLITRLALSAISIPDSPSRWITQAVTGHLNTVRLPFPEFPVSDSVLERYDRKHIRTSLWALFQV